MSTTIVRVAGSEETHSPLVQHNVISLSILTLLIGAGMYIALGWPSEPLRRCDGVLVFDGAAVVKTLIALLTATTLWMAYEYRQKEQMRAFEFAILILMASLGLSLLVGAYDLIALYIALELRSLC